jgi:hypothetical protein
LLSVLVNKTINVYRLKLIILNPYLFLSLFIYWRRYRNITINQFVYFFHVYIQRWPIIKAQFKKKYQLFKQRQIQIRARLWLTKCSTKNQSCRSHGNLAFILPVAPLLSFEHKNIDFDNSLDFKSGLGINFHIFIKQITHEFQI